MFYRKSEQAYAADWASSGAADADQWPDVAEDSGIDLPAMARWLGQERRANENSQNLQQYRKPSAVLAPLGQAGFELKCSGKQEKPTGDLFGRDGG